MPASEATDETVEMMQARLEEIRHAAGVTTPSGGNKSPGGLVDITSDTEEVECSDCGVPFDTIVTTTPDGKKHHFPRCNDCASALHEAEEPTQKASLSLSELHGLLGRVGVNVRKHGNCDITTWDGDDEVAAAVRDFITETALAGRHEPVLGLYLHGPTGVGKTHLAVAAARSHLRMSAEKYDPYDPLVRFERVSKLVTTIQDTYGTGQTGSVIHRLEIADLLVLDDLGAEKATPDVMRILTDLLSARELHPTLITSNYHPAQLVERHGADWQRMESRLGPQNFKLVEIKGEDRRFHRP